MFSEFKRFGGEIGSHAVSTPKETYRMGELGGNTVNVNSILFVGSTPAQTT